MWPFKNKTKETIIPSKTQNEFYEIKLKDLGIRPGILLNLKHIIDNKNDFTVLYGSGINPKAILIQKQSKEEYNNMVKTHKTCSMAIGDFIVMCSTNPGFKGMR